MLQLIWPGGGNRVICMVLDMYPGLNLHCTDPAQHPRTAGWDLHDLSVDDMSVGDLAVDDLSEDDLAADDLSADDLSANDLSVDGLSVDDLSVDDLSVDGLSVNDISVNNNICALLSKTFWNHSDPFRHILTIGCFCPCPPTHHPQ